MLDLESEFRFKEIYVIFWPYFDGKKGRISSIEYL